MFRLRAPYQPLLIRRVCRKTQFLRGGGVRWTIKNRGSDGVG
ncbi:hypothetical protein A11S_1068 [Micavibrio aeruginosavorus EPB]|uniref:Uncharacterized protein n=1 Tax=Micavibrio aeruginosavorus EPB TaxID=349215 RepID=M4VIL4_9BACT|nr:hypothetical protein A11S_1068 [Micavibrio aeruginosavorus EPB]